MPTFSWTQYSFHTPDQPLTREAWAALRATSTADHERIIAEMKAERWAQFWRDHSYYKWFLGIFLGGLLVFNVAEDKSGLKGIAALAVFLTFVGCFSLLFTASSHASALFKQCRHFRSEFGRAAASESYDVYLERYRSRSR